MLEAFSVTLEYLTSADLAMLGNFKAGVSNEGSFGTNKELRLVKFAETGNMVVSKIRVQPLGCPKIKGLNVKSKKDERFVFNNQMCVRSREPNSLLKSEVQDVISKRLQLI